VQTNSERRRNELERRLRESLSEIEQDVSDQVIERLLAYMALLMRWNRVFNLTGAKSADQLLDAHIVGSLSALPFLNEGPALDVGSGAGFPGLVLACVEPQRPWVLLDSNGKKARFLRQAVIELGLPKVAVVRRRLEQFRPEQRLALITVRAVGGLANIWKTVRPWLTATGRVIVFRGEAPDAESAECAAAGACVRSAAVELPRAAGRQHLVILETQEAGEADRKGSHG
jgi:16S rRNA (guanine527-N7)-methyltransferase